MSRVTDISRALSESFQAYDETLRQRLGQIRDGQLSYIDHLIDINDDHQVTADQIGLGLIHNQPIASPLVLDQQLETEHYVDIEGAIYYIRSNLNLGQVVDSEDPISPIGGQDINTLRPKLRGGDYFNAYGIARGTRRFQLDLIGGDYNTPLIDVTVTGNDLVLPSDLQNLTEYRWRYKDTAVDEVEGAWKEAEFRVAYEIVLTPTVTVDGGVVSTPLNPTFVASAFQVNTGTDTHVGSVWTLYDNLGGVVETYTKTTGDLTTWTPSTLLDITTTYRAEVYYTADTYEQSGVAEVTFETTDGIIIPPTVTVPQTPTGPFDITVQWQGTDPSGLDTHQSTSLQISRDPSFTDLVLDQVESTTDLTSAHVDFLPDLTDFYIRARAHGSSLGYSEWSNVTTLTTGVYEGTTTEIEDPIGDVELTAGTGLGPDSILGGTNTQSPGQPVVIYRSPQGIQWSKRLTGIVSSGTITSVVTDANYIYAVGVQTDHAKSFIVSLSMSGAVRWCKVFAGGSEMVFTDMVYGDKLYVCGYGDGYNGTGQVGTCGIVMALSITGDQQWAKTIGGSGQDRFHGLDYGSGSVVVVGGQSSDFGTTVTASRCASVVSLSISGTKQWERYWGIGTDSHHVTVAIVGTRVLAGGESGGKPSVSVYQLSDGNEVSHSVDSSTNGRVTGLVLGSGDVPFISGSSDNGAFLVKLPSVTNLTPTWSVMDNQSLTDGFGILTDNGVELVSRMAIPGKTSAVISRIPPNGAVATPPYLVGYGWESWSLSLSSEIVVEAQIYGAWSSWLEYEVGVNKSSSSSSTPPTVGSSEQTSASGAGYDDQSDVRQTRDLGFRNPEHYSQSGNRWVYKSTTTNTTWRSSQITNYQPPAGSGTTDYRNGSATLLSTRDVRLWGSWSDGFWHSGFIHATHALASQHANSHKSATVNAAAANPGHEVRSLKTLTVKSVEGWAGVVEWEKRSSTGTKKEYQYRISYDIYRLEGYNYSAYRWDLCYDYRTRSKVPVEIPIGTNLSLNASNGSPANTDLSLDIHFSNF